MNKKQRSCDVRGARSAHFWRVNEPKKTGARSARARTRGQNPLVSIYTNRRVYPLVVLMTSARYRASSGVPSRDSNSCLPYSKPAPKNTNSNSIELALTSPFLRVDYYKLVLISFSLTYTYCTRNRRTHVEQTVLTLCMYCITDKYML